MEFPTWLAFGNEWWTFGVYFLTILFLVGVSEFSLKNQWLTADTNRKMVHLIVGLATSASPFIFSSNRQPITLAIIFIIVNAIALRKETFKGIHSQKRLSYGTVYFPIAYLLLTTFFWGYPEFIVLSMIILAISDPLAATIKGNIKKPHFFKVWYDYKSVQGCIAFFISSFIIVYLGSTFFQIQTLTIPFAFFVATGATMGEMVSRTGSDNVSIPIISMLFMIFYTDMANQEIMLTSFLLFVMILIFSMAYHLKSVSRSGFYGGLIMGTLIIFSGGVETLYPLFIFFILSSILSKVIKKESKIQSKGSERDIIQVYANGSIPLLISLWMYFNPSEHYMPLFLTAVAAAMADTWSTEFGKLSKQSPISILTFQKVPSGTSGGITLTGTLGALLGSSIFVFSVWFFFPIYGQMAYGIIICGFLGSIIDSILGDSVQAKYQSKHGLMTEIYEDGAVLNQGYPWINNDMVNFLSTLIAPFLMYVYLMLV